MSMLTVGGACGGGGSGGSLCHFLQAPNKAASSTPRNNSSSARRAVRCVCMALTNLHQYRLHVLQAGHTCAESLQPRTTALTASASIATATATTSLQQLQGASHSPQSCEVTPCSNTPLHTAPVHPMCKASPTHSPHPSHSHRHGVGMGAPLEQGNAELASSGDRGLCTDTIVGRCQGIVGPNPSKQSATNDKRGLAKRTK